jgi:hypothetical protein
VHIPVYALAILPMKAIDHYSRIRRVVVSLLS